MKFNGVDVEMKLDSRANWSTVPWTLYQEKLTGVCKLILTDVTLYQYDKSSLMRYIKCKTLRIQYNLYCAKEPLIVSFQSIL